MTASPDPVLPGGIVTYRLTVTNSGTRDLTGVVLSDLVPGHTETDDTSVTDGGDCIRGFTCSAGNEVRWSLGTLPAGASRTVSMAVRVGSGSGVPSDGTLIYNSAQVRDGSGRGAAAERSVVVDATPVLTLGMATGREPVDPGGLLTYTLIFGNRGSVNAPGVDLSATLPTGTTFVSASGGGTITGGVVSWSLGMVSNGESGQRQFTVAVDGRAADGSLLFSEAEIRDTASTEDNARADAATAVWNVSPLTLSMTASPDPVLPGGIVTYRLTVTNSGTRDLTGVVLSDLVPGHTETDDTSVTDGGDCIRGFTCSAGNEVRWSLGTLPAGASRTVSMAVRVGSGSGVPSDGTLIYNSAQVRDGSGGGAAAERSVRICAGGGTKCDHKVILPLLTVTKSGTGTGTVTSSPAGINCGTDCSESYPSGTVVTLTATPDTGSTFANWSGGGCNGTETCTVTMDAAKSVTATFTRQFTLTVTKSGTGSGTVTSSPIGIDCGANCSESYTSGTVVTLTATPASGSTFAGWSEEGCSGTGACTVTMDAAKLLTATLNRVTGATFTKTYAPPGGFADIVSGKVTTDGEFVVTGIHSDLADSLNNLMVARLSPTGEVIWERTLTTAWAALSGSGADIDLSVDGGFVVVASTTSGALIAKIDGIGTPVWQKILRGSGFVGLTSIHRTQDDGYVVGGVFGDEAAGHVVSGFVVKITSVGSIQWQRVIRGVFRVFVRERPDGGYIAAGAVDGGLQPIAIVRFGQQGEVESITGFHHPGLFSGPVGMDATSDGGVVFASDQSSVEPLAGVAVVVKVGSGNQVEWTRQFDGFFVESFGTNPIRQTRDGGYIVGISVVSPGITANAGLAKLSGSGELLWARYLQSPQTTADVVAETPDGGYVSFGDAATNNFGLLMKVDATGRIPDCQSFLDVPQTSVVPSVEEVAPGVSIEAGTLVVEDTLLSTIAVAFSVTTICEGQGADTTLPTVSAFSATPGSLTLGNVFTISYTVSDAGGSGLSRVELWRANDSDGTPTGWAEIKRTSLSGNGPSSGSFSDAPSSAGTYWYGIHVVDNAGNLDLEPNPPSPTKVTVTAPDTIYTITVTKSGTGSGTVTSSPDGIDCGADCSEPYTSGTSVTLTATPASSSRFDGWSGGGCSGTGTCTVTMDAAKSVTATFNLQTFALTVSKSGTGSGTVTSSPTGIDCGADCSEPYTSGTSVTLTATPASGSRFDGWSGGGCSGTGTCTVTMDAAKSVTATFNGPPSKRAIRAVDTSGAPGSPISVPIELVAQGDENGLGFSLTYDPTLLTFSQAALDNGASGATLNLNTNQTAQGRLGIGLALPAGQKFAAGTRQIVVVSFTVASGTTATSTTVGFGDQPISREVADANANVLPAIYIPGTVTISPGFEGDVAPRPNGNNNGSVTIADWVQTGRYAAGLDAVVPAGGPTGPPQVPCNPTIAKGGPAAQGTRVVRAVDMTFQVGEVNSLIIELEAQGEENALGFSLIYDSTLLTFSQAVLGNDASGATLNINTNQTVQGRLGIALALPAGQRFAAGTRQIVVVSFTVASGTTATSTTVGFGDQPISREVADANANVLSATYADATVTLEGVAIDPREGTLGTEFTLTGTNFGTKKGKVLVGTKGCKVLKWTDTSIRCSLQTPMTPGTYDVTIKPGNPTGASPIVVEGGFTIMAPAIDFMDPANGSAGDRITIRGSFFGTKKGGVYLGYIEKGKNRRKIPRVVSWTMDPTTGESEIMFVVPQRLSPGTYVLTVKNKVGSATEGFTID